MTCVLCGRTFEPGADDPVCKGCALFGGCKRVRCPHCGGEMPKEPAFVSWMFGRGKQGKRKDDDAPAEG